MAAPWGDYPYHPVGEQLVDLLRQQTQNTRSDYYFRMLTAFIFAQMAANMRCMVITGDRGAIPVNAYVCAFMESGAGKGHSLNILEEKIVNQFKDEFTNSTFPYVAEQTMLDEARTKSVRHASDPNDELEKLQKEFFSFGAMPYTFSEGTGPAYKQIRTKAQMAGIGALNYMCDEIGSNILTSQELLSICLETYDVGKVKDKITKSSSDNVRQEPRSEPVPSNLLVFGTPAKVFNGAKEEAEYISLLETGYGRRFFFGFGNKGSDDAITNAEELYDLLASNATTEEMDIISDQFKELADIKYLNLRIVVERTEGIALLQYKLDCEAIADTFPDHEHIRKAEMQHRYFKVLKLAGAYAFVDKSPKVTLEHLYAAIRVAEDSGIAFNQIMSRPKPYERLARYIATVGTEVTHADLAEALPFYKGTLAVKMEMLQLAQAWGYKNNIIIKVYKLSGIEFLRGESLKENDLSEMILSYSADANQRYRNAKTPWEQLTRLMDLPNLNWTNHAVLNGDKTMLNIPQGVRGEANAINGFNMLVLDVNSGIPMDTVRRLLNSYTALYVEAKDSTEIVNKFQVILPIQYNLKLDGKDYVEFINNVYDWLPFEVNKTINHRSHAWVTPAGKYSFSTGVLFDPLQFIPLTSKNEEYRKATKALSMLGQTERWFLETCSLDRAEVMLLKFAHSLLDQGEALDKVALRVTSLNSRMSEPMTIENLNANVINIINL